MTDHQDTNPPTAAEAKPEATDPQPKEEEKKDEPGKLSQSGIFAMFGGGPARKREEPKEKGTEGEDGEEGEKGEKGEKDEKTKSGEV